MPKIFCRTEKVEQREDGVYIYIAIFHPRGVRRTFFPLPDPDVIGSEAGMTARLKQAAVLVGNEVAGASFTAADIILVP